MPQVKGGQGQKAKGRGKPAPKTAKKPTPATDAVVKQTADASSIVLSVFFIIALLIGFAAWMGQSVNVVTGTANTLTDGFVKTIGLSVDDIRVYHAAPEQERKIRSAIGVQIGDSMFRADPNILKERIDSVKGIGSVDVHRHWPGDISIMVTPLKASVLYLEGDTRIAMNTLGQEVPLTEGDGAHHPVVSGAGSVEASADLSVALNSFPAVQSRIEASHRIGDRRWDLHMISGVVVQLPEGFDAQLEALESLHKLHAQTAILDRQVKKIDLRHPDQIFVRKSQSGLALATLVGRG